MKHQLSFCTVEEIEDSIFEVFVKGGITVDAKCAQEELEFWTKHRNEPFGILLNCTTSFAYDFEGASQIGKSPFQKKIAVVTYTNLQYASNSMAIQVSQIQMPEKVARVFHTRNDALAWLRVDED